MQSAQESDLEKLFLGHEVGARHGRERDRRRVGVTEVISREDGGAAPG